ncbi:Oxygen-independent coproporphyrinogen-III oxidase 1 [Jannaschia seosinensis]|uniref:Oxygen-independent coproporphyrinogen-III oxidase 1 n=2 Tax=Jannaschia seosinensis TaxID=313367 RepID=A0A0M7B9F1_9RHOB|nr:Oxygen-independent coproporphyrinogen-III oxidase 1 [Jannaschia seosinensis]
MPPETVAAIVAAARTLWTPANDLEVTLEANPTSVEAERFNAFGAAGVNRFSVGLQALDDADLRRLGRLHSVAEGRHAYEVARSVTDRVSFDLIYARQDQPAAAWERELKEALTFAGEHLSLYQLTIEEGTAFGARHAVGRLNGLPDEDRAVDLWHVTQELCAEAGFRRYETSNHAVPGRESRHNFIYWRGGDWIGVGPGAHGRVTIGADRSASEAHKMPQKWLAANEDSGTGTAHVEYLQKTGVADEYVMMGLRLDEGIDLDYVASLSKQLDTRRVDELVEEGYLVRAPSRLIATASGALVLNAVLAAILTET